MNVLVFDIETVPDTDTARRLYDLHDLSDAEVASVMFSRRQQETDGKSDFLRQHLHRVVAISLVMRRDDKLSVWSLGEEDSGERELVERFFEGIDRFSPTLVSWNGGGFDLPVLHYRALKYGIPAARYWDTGSDDQSFRWNNYISRYHQRHTDLMDVIAGYQPRAVAPLHEIATMLGFPGKLGMDGSKVWDTWLAGERGAIRDYCETDVLNTYLVFLQFELVRGTLNEVSLKREQDRLREYLQTENKPHFQDFLSAWNDASVSDS